MSIPSTQRSPGDHFKIVANGLPFYVTSITKAKTWKTTCQAEGQAATIIGITPYGKHKTDTCEQGCTYCAKSVGKGGRESKEVRRAEVKESYSNVDTVKTEDLEVGDVLFGGQVRIVECMGDGSFHPKKKYARYPEGRVFSIAYIKGPKSGKLGELHIKLGLKLAVTR